MSKKISNPPPPPGRFKPPPPTSPPPRLSDVHVCEFETRLERVTAERDLAVTRCLELTQRNADLLALAKQYASECGECDGNGRANGCEAPTAEPCPDCIGIRAVIRKAEPQS